MLMSCHELSSITIVSLLGLASSSGSARSITRESARVKGRDSRASISMETKTRVES